MKNKEFEIPVKHRGTCNPGRIKEIYSDNPPPPDYFTPVNNDEIEILPKETE